MLHSPPGPRSRWPHNDARIVRRTRWGARLLLALAPLLLAGQALAVDAPPVLTAFTIATSTVDTSASPDIVAVALDAHDLAPGLCLSSCDDGGAPSQLHLVHPGSGQRHVAMLEPNVFGVGYLARVELPAGAAGGTWQVETLWLADQSGNRRRFTTADLSGLGYATSLDNLAAGGPTTPPAPTSVSVLSLLGTATPQVLVSVQPYDSGLCRAPVCADPAGPSQVRMRHPETGQTRTAFVQRELYFVGGGFAYDNRARIDFPPGSASGEWIVEWADLVDVYGNRTRLDAGALATLPRPIDSTSGAIVAVFGVQATDVGSGLCVDACEDGGGTSQVVYKRDGADHRRFGPLAADPGSPDIYLALLTIPPSADADVWRPDQLMLVDRAGNRFVPEPALTLGLLTGVVALAATRLLSSGRERALRAR